MNLDRTEIEKLIPHRGPFLLLDRITEISAQKVSAQYRIKTDNALFQQVLPFHYPGSPITPGVLLCEMIFQAGAALMAHRLMSENNTIKGAPVITRIRDARFKNMILPESELAITAEFEDQVSTAYYLKGSVECEGKLALRVAFTCALAGVE